MIKIRKKLLVSCFVLCQPLVAAEKLSLSEAFLAAKRHSETVQIQEEQIKQAEENYQQAIGALLPSINGVASYLEQGKAVGTVSPKKQPFMKISLTQPLFRGLREYAAIRDTKLSEQIQVFNKDIAIKNLLLDVVANYLTILSLEQDLKNLQKEIQDFEKRIRELEGRIHIGRSRDTEVLTTKVSVSNLKSSIAQIEGAIQVARETLFFLTGLPQNSSLQDAVDVKLETLPTYLSRVNARAEVMVAQTKINQSDEAIQEAWGAHLPSIDLIGNYYTKRTGTLENVPWDVTLSLTLPIYDGGMIRSKTHIAVSQKSQAELQLQSFLRSAANEITLLYQTVVSDQKQLTELGRSKDLGKENVDRLSREYRNGLITNVDVLQAIASWDEAIRSLDKMKFATGLDFIKLKIAANQSDLLN